MIKGKKLWVFVAGAVLLVVSAVDGYADILFKGRQPLKIGKGAVVGNTIRWTDCSGNNAQSYDAPPYSLDAADNCAVGPPSFGLDCEGTSCRVVDETKIQKYLPSLHNGDKVRLEISEHSVALQSTKGAVQLER